MHEELPGGSLAPSRWAIALLAATLGLLLTIATGNAVVDPTAQLGWFSTFQPVSEGPRDRADKVRLALATPAPDLVVLGSSRAKKLDPARVDPSAAHPLNAAMVGGDLFEARVMAALLAERDDPFPQLVVTVDVEQFRDGSLQGSGLLDVPAARTVARREAAGEDGTITGDASRLEHLLLSWQVTRASLVSVRARVRGATGDGAPADTRSTGGFTAQGLLVSDSRWFEPGAAERFARRTPGRVAASIEDYRATYEDVGARLDPDSVDDLRALVRIVHDAGGPAPLLVLTPTTEAFADALREHGRVVRRRAVLQLLRDVARHGQARVIDCSTCIDDADTNWIDAVHPSPLGAQQWAARIAAAAHHD